MILQDSYFKLTENFRKFCGVKIAKNEICYILIGKRIGRFWFGQLVRKVVGSPDSVEFDWEWVLKREEEKGDVLGFWHTHTKEGTPSDRDVDTMVAWVNCFYKPLLCIIQDSFRKQGFSVMHVEVKRTQGILVAWFPLKKIYKFFQFIVVRE